MKIFIIDEKNMPFYEDKIQGGIQYVVKNQYNLIKDDHETKLFVTNDSIFNDSNLIKSKLKSRKNEEISSIQYNKQRNEEICFLVNKFQPDLIINHDQSNNSFMKILYSTLNDFPSITFMHNSYEVIGGIAGFSYLQELNNLIQNKKIVLNVSKTSMNEWNQYAKKYGKGLIDPKFLIEDMFESYHYNYYVPDDIDIKESENYMLMVSRISPDKKIHVAAKYCQELNIPFELCYTPPRNDSEIDYFKQLQELNITFHENLPRTDVIDKISSAKGIFICGPESFGLVSAEANTYGVPCILISRKTEHPVIETSNNLIQLNSKSKKENLEILSKMKKLSYDEKIKKSKEFCDKFSKENCKNSLYSIIDSAISLNRTREVNNLENFFN